jgi:cyclopropane fatty-acyl-phospholipid synthase-like methyltransferase
MNKLIATYSQVLRGEATGHIAPEPWNYGYWNPDTKDRAQASESLLRHLVAKLGAAPGRVLDVAFGKGESTRLLCEVFGAHKVTGINIALDQVEHARRSGVSCELRVMNAAELQFPAETFNAILCIEAAFHFRTREQFLRGAFRTLRPGGRLVMSDLLFRSNHGLDAEVFPTENLVDSIDVYARVFEHAGFRPADVEIHRTTDRQLLPLARRMAEAAGVIAGKRGNEARMNPLLARWSVWFIVTRLLNVEDCVTVCAIKN